ncbi:MAG: SH3 domain-containing protein [Chloroflexota bacterium]
MFVAVSRCWDSIARSFTSAKSPVHWPSAILGLVLAVVVVVAVAWLAAARRPSAAYATTLQSEPVATPIAVPTPIPQPAVVQPPAPAPERVKVANTRGMGANLRAAPGERATRVKTANEGTILEIVGPDQRLDGGTWRNVRDSAGATGWIIGTLLTPAGDIAQR